MQKVSFCSTDTEENLSHESLPKAETAQGNAKLLTTREPAQQQVPPAQQAVQNPISTMPLVAHQQQQMQPMPIATQPMPMQAP